MNEVFWKEWGKKNLGKCISMNEKPNVDLPNQSRNPY